MNHLQTAATPDWSHIRETINMLYLAMCQIEATLADSNPAIETLTKSFIQLAEHTNNVSQQVQEIQRVEDLSEFKADIGNTAKEMNTNINASIQAFQFYDRICQRLDHVSRGLESVSTIMADESLINNEIAWRQVQERIKSSYTMEAELIMFEFIMRGGSVEEALKIYRHHFELQDKFANDKGDEIQLF